MTIRRRRKRRRKLKQWKRRERRLRPAHPNANLCHQHRHVSLHHHHPNANSTPRTVLPKKTKKPRHLKKRPRTKVVKKIWIKIEPRISERTRRPRAFCCDLQVIVKHEISSVISNLKICQNWASFSFWISEPKSTNTTSVFWLPSCFFEAEKKSFLFWRNDV